MECESKYNEESLYQQYFMEITSDLCRAKKGRLLAIKISYVMSNIIY